MTKKWQNQGKINGFGMQLVEKQLLAWTFVTADEMINDNAEIFCRLVSTTDD
jgi:hypothetical protein